MKRKIWIDPERIEDRSSMGSYMTEVFGFVENVRGLDALNDMLSEVAAETAVCVTRENMSRICEMPYAYKVLMVLADASEDNPYLSFHLKERNPKENV